MLGYKKVFTARKSAAFGPYILKAEVLDVRTPQKIQIFRRKIVLERGNYQSQSLKANNSALCYQ